MSNMADQNKFSLISDCGKESRVEIGGHANVSINVGNTDHSWQIGNLTINSPSTANEAQQLYTATNVSGPTDMKESTRRNEQPGEHHEMCRRVNVRTMKTTDVKITEDFKHELNEPTCDVYPQMRKVKNYFKGGYENVEEEEIVTTTKCLCGNTRKVTKNQTRRETGFYYEKQRGADELISLKEFFESIMKDRKQKLSKKIPITAIVASAGSGKSTLMRRIARMSVGVNPSTTEKCTPTDQRNPVKMVHYIEMKDMIFNESIKPSRLLFGGIYENKAWEDEAYKWLLDHQSEAIIYFDGLDQALFNMNDSKRNMNSFDSGNTAEIMYNIFSRNLLPYVKIVIASREFKVSELPAKARPEEIISLVGLKKKDAQNFFGNLIGDKRGEIWSRMSHMSPRLVNLISVPIFLILTAVVIARRPSGSPPPATVTELYTRIMLCLPRVETIRERVKIPTVIKKMKKMAHKAMMEGRVVFYEPDLKQVGLTIENARDLLIKVPGKNLLSRYLLEGDFVFFFCHQSLQEFLSASYISELTYQEFSRMTRKHLFESRWSVVRMFVCGIINQQDSSVGFHEVSKVRKKRNFFNDALRSQIAERRNVADLLSTLYEASNDNDNDLSRSLPNPLSVFASHIFCPDDAYMYGYILARSTNQRIQNDVDLSNCAITDDLIDIMIQGWVGRKFNVGLVNLKRNKFTITGFIALLTHLDIDKLIVDYDILMTWQYRDLIWNNIRQINSGSIIMFNNKDYITIDGIVEGCYYKTPPVPQSVKQLSLKWSELEYQVTKDLYTFFQRPKSFELTAEEPYFTRINLEMKEKKEHLSMEYTQIDDFILAGFLDFFQPKSVDIKVKKKRSMTAETRVEMETV